MVYDILLVLLGCVIGTFFTRIIRDYNNKKSLKLLQDEINTIFKKILFNVDSGKTNYFSRINNNVTINTELDNLGLISIVYLIDKKDIVIFSGDRCIYTSDMVDEEIIKSIIDSIESTYNVEINDTVNVMGMIYYRIDFEKKFNIKVDDLKKNMFGPNTNNVEVSDVEQIIQKNKDKLNIDSILDKISSVGIDSLTDAEKKFLENYSNG